MARSYVALGSNVGRCVAAMATATRSLAALEGTTVVNSSMMYRSMPQLVEDQADFLNAVVQLETELSPLQLLHSCQAIERSIGRSPSRQRYGPREIDLDVVLYESEVVNTTEFLIPHERMHERDFVLQPLVDLGAGNFVHPTLKKSISELLSASEKKPDSLTRVMAFQNPDVTWPLNKTYLMGIINVTPDSFSDGGRHESVQGAVDCAKELWVDGAAILDVGGQSTRPNALHVSPEEEEKRVIPVISAIRREIPDALISVDTFFSNVAQRAVLAGANMINDISGGLYDANMLKTVADLDVPYVFMHMRGTPQSMNSKAEYGEDVVSEVLQELLHRYNACIEAGIRRWNLVADPGIGFAKKSMHNVALLRKLPHLNNLPMLVGPSRKRFIGDICGVVKACDRDWGTAATVVAGIHGGADIVRVHRVRGLIDAASMADAIYRPFC